MDAFENIVATILQRLDPDQREGDVDQVREAPNRTVLRAAMAFKAINRSLNNIRVHEEGIRLANLALGRAYSSYRVATFGALAGAYETVGFGVTEGASGVTGLSWQDFVPGLASHKAFQVAKK